MPTTKANILALLDQGAQQLSALASSPEAPAWAPVLALGLPFLRTSMEQRDEGFYTDFFARVVASYACLAGDELGDFTYRRSAGGPEARWSGRVVAEQIIDLGGDLSAVWASLLRGLAALPVPDLGGGLLGFGQVNPRPMASPEVPPAPGDH